MSQPTHTATFEARYLTVIPAAFSHIKGDRPIMLSYRIGQILQEVRQLHANLREALSSYVKEDGSELRSDLKQEEVDAIDAFMTEELTIEVPTITVQELQDAGLYVEDDTVLLFLVEDVGLLKA